MNRLNESATEAFSCNMQILHIAFRATMLDTGSPLPNPLPQAGEGTIALSSSRGDGEREGRCDEFLEVP